MAPPHGRCPRGQRLYAKVPHGHWKTTTFVAALRHNGVTAPFVLDGPINGECFFAYVKFAYVKEVLAPTLSEGDIVLIDNSPPASPTAMPVGASSQLRSARTRARKSGK